MLFQTNQEQQQEELGVLRSRLQHQIHNQLQATPPRRLAIVPPLPRCTSTPHSLPDCAPGTPSTPGGVDCSTLPSSAGGANCSPLPPANCSPYPPASNCSPHPATSSACSPHPAPPSGAHCSPHPLSSGATGCSPLTYAPGASTHSSMGSGGTQDLLSAPKMCPSPLDKHGSSGMSLLSQGQTLLQDLLQDFDP